MPGAADHQSQGLVLRRPEGGGDAAGDRIGGDAVGSKVDPAQRGPSRISWTAKPSGELQNPRFRPLRADFALSLIDGGALRRYSASTVHPPGAPQGSSLWRVFSCAGSPAGQAA